MLAVDRFCARPDSGQCSSRRLRGCAPGAASLVAALSLMASSIGADVIKEPPRQVPHSITLSGVANLREYDFYVAVGPRKPGYHPVKDGKLSLAGEPVGLLFAVKKGDSVEEAAIPATGGSSHERLFPDDLIGRPGWITAEKTMLSEESIYPPSGPGVGVSTRIEVRGISGTRIELEKTRVVEQSRLSGKVALAISGAAALALAGALFARARRRRMSTAPAGA